VNYNSEFKGFNKLPAPVRFCLGLEPMLAQIMIFTNLDLVLSRGNLPFDFDSIYSIFRLYYALLLYIRIRSIPYLNRMEIKKKGSWDSIGCAYPVPEGQGSW
jgi:hypothetical protein